MVKCLLCEGEYEDDSSLHRHLKIHKLRIFEYYQSAYPRHDRFDGSMILFKNKKQYFESDFNSAKNMRLWLDKQTPEDRYGYLRGLLIKRRNEKGIINAPCQVELRSLKIPGIHYFNQVFGSYYNLTKELGFRNRHSIGKELVASDIFKSSDAKILVDSREQTPLKMGCPSEVQGLKFGDYSFFDAEKAGNVFVERKSLNDFIGTLSNGFERFEREIIRAKEAKAYLVILVEEGLSNVIRFNVMDQIARIGMKVTPEYVFHNVRDLIQRHHHIQFLFVKDRVEAADMILKLFSYGEQIKKIDLQLAYDEGRL